MAELIKDAYMIYGYNCYRSINAFLRCQEDSHMSPEIPEAIITLLPGLLYPFKLDHELVVYRADNMEVSTKMFVVKGMLSTSIFQNVSRGYGDKRNLKIRIPAGAHFMPMLISSKSWHYEITLLPGTKLELVQKEQAPDGKVKAEYVVTENPEDFSEEEVASILRGAISRVEGDKITNKPTNQENLQFVVDLVNRKYGGYF